MGHEEVPKVGGQVGDKLASWSVDKKRTRTSESKASGSEGGTPEGTDVGEGEGSSEQGVRGATTGCRRASAGSCAVRVDAGVNDSSVAGTGGEENDGSSPRSDEEITATSVAGGEIGSRDAET